MSIKTTAKQYILVFDCSGSLFTFSFDASKPKEIQTVQKDIIKIPVMA
jgi:hypothetical protein